MAPGGYPPGRQGQEQIGAAAAMLNALNGKPHGGKRDAETSILESLARAFTTPSIVGRLRDCCNKERKCLKATDPKAAATIQRKLDEAEASAAMEENNVQEQSRQEWIAAKNLAEAAAAAAGGMVRGGSAAAQTKGRKRKYANEEERKQAQAAQAEKRRADKKAQQQANGAREAGAPECNTLVACDSPGTDNNDHALVLADGRFAASNLADYEDSEGTDTSE